MAHCSVRYLSAYFPQPLQTLRICSGCGKYASPCFACAARGANTSRRLPQLSRSQPFALDTTAHSSHACAQELAAAISDRLEGVSICHRGVCWSFLASDIDSM